MACEHERIECTNCVKKCLICGAVLPADFIPGKHAPETETPTDGEKTAKKATRKKAVK